MTLCQDRDLGLVGGGNAQPCVHCSDSLRQFLNGFCCSRGGETDDSACSINTVDVLFGERSHSHGRVGGHEYPAPVI